MAIYTTTDRDNVKAAIIDLATGKRVVSTEVGGKARDFHQTNLPALRALLAEISADLAADTAISGARRVSTTIKSDTW
jgi:hypothetical protein